MARTSDGVPSTARVVIVGGGIMGCGLAYHLALEGWRDVVLLEKAELTSGSTWHAAGQITRSTSSFSLGKCVDYNIFLYSGALQEHTGRHVSWHGCGSLRLAYSEDELDWFNHILSVGEALGFDLEVVGPNQISRLHPFYNLEGVLGALHTPDDGHVDPAGVTHAMAAGARGLGVRIVQRCRACDIQQSTSGGWRVRTEAGDIACEHVVNAAGTYARQVGAWCGLQVPATSMTHHYLVTETVSEFEALEQELPVVRDDRMVSGYIRMEQKAGLVGIYEKADPRSVWEDHCPWDVENELLTPDYDRILPWLNNAMVRMPVLKNSGIRRVVHGAISHPPDGNPLIGPAPGARNYWCCCGTQIGIGWGPGLTRELARWMVHGAADISMRDFDPRRFGSHADRDWQVIKAKEDYSLRHEIPFPNFNRLAGRPVKPSPLYGRLKARGAVFEEVYGHERPRWFSNAAVPQRDLYSFRRNALHELVGAECQGVRDAAGIMDITAFCKLELGGRDAASFLDRVIPNRLPARDGRIILTHFLNESGRIELEATVVRLAENRFYIVAAAFFEQRLVDHLNRIRRVSESITITNLSDSWAALAINGPRSRSVLAATTPDPLDNQRFPWLSSRSIAVSGHRILASRLSYAGELGWELHGPREAFPDVYDALIRAGSAHGIVDYGSFAMNSMRMEKGFPGAGELTNEVTLVEANFMRFVDMSKEFIGKKATGNSLEAPLRWVRVFIEIESDGRTDGHGGEAVLHHGMVVGSTTSVAHGFRVGKTLAFAYVKPDAARAGTCLTVNVMGQYRSAKVLDRAVYDPENKLPRSECRGDIAA